MKVAEMKKIMIIALVALGFNGYAQTADEISSAIEKEEFAKARSLCRQLIAKDAKSSEGHFFLGESFYEDQNVDSARYYYNKGLAVNDGSALCLIGQSKLLLNEGKVAEAQKGFEKAAKWKRKDAYTIYQVGKAYIDAQKPDANKAIEWIDKAILMDPKPANFFSTLGDAYFVKADYGTALTKYENASRKNPQDVKNYVKRARINKAGRILKEAEANLNEALKLDPNYAPALKELTEVYVASGQYAKVAPVLQKYTSLIGKSDLSSRERLVRYLSYYAQDYETAIKEAKEVLTLDANRSTMNRWLAWSYTGLGLKQEKEKNDAATESFKQGAAYAQKFLANNGTTEIVVDDVDKYMTCALKSKDFDQYNALIPRLLAIDSTKKECYATVAKAYYDNKMWAKAFDAYEVKINKLGAIWQDRWYQAGCGLASKDNAKADASYAKVIELSPANIDAYAERGRLAEMNDPELKAGTARPFHEKVIELGSAKEDKYGKMLAKSHYYLGAYNAFLALDYAKALDHFNQVVRLDPTNTDAQTAAADMATRVGGK